MNRWGPPGRWREEEEVTLSTTPAEEIVMRSPRRTRNPGALTSGRRKKDGSRTRLRLWLPVAGLALMVALLTAGWSAVQLTSRGDAERAIGEALVPLTEVDRLLSRDYEVLVGQAAAGETGSVIVEGYPLGLAVPASEMATMSRSELRARLLSESAAQIYENGVGIFAREPGGSGGPISARGIYALTVGQLTARSHKIAIIAAAVLLLSLAPLLMLAMSGGSRALRLRNLGVGLTLAGGGLTAVALALQVGLRLWADGSEDIFSGALLDQAGDLAGLPIRNGIIVGTLGLLVAVGSVGAALCRKRGGRERESSMRWC